MSRLPNQDLPNFGQQVSTLRIDNFDVKSKWAKMAIFSDIFDFLGLFFEDAGQSLLAATQNSEILLDEAIEYRCLVFNLDVV